VIVAKPYLWDGLVRGDQEVAEHSQDDRQYLRNADKIYLRSLLSTRLAPTTLHKRWLFSINQSIYFVNLDPTQSIFRVFSRTW